MPPEYNITFIFLDLTTTLGLLALILNSKGVSNLQLLTYSTYPDPEQGGHPEEVKEGHDDPSKISVIVILRCLPAIPADSLIVAALPKDGNIWLAAFLHSAAWARLISVLCRL